MSIRRIVVAVDGSANSIVAVGWAAELAAAAGAEVVAVHALGLLERQGSAGLVPARPHRDEIAAQLSTTWCAPLRDAGVPFRCELVDGSPVEVVLRTAETEQADLIVIGSRGVGAYPALLLGSTSTQVVQRSPRPVTVVPDPESHR